MSSNVLNKRISVSKALNILLVVILVLVVIFGYLYFTKTSPVSVIQQALPADPTAPPEYLYTIYGREGDYFNMPQSTTVSDRTIYVADMKDSRIMVFDYTGKFIRQIGKKGTGRGDMDAPAEVAIYNNNLYVADIGLRKVGIYSLDGNFVGYFAEKAIKGPSAIKVVNDTFYVFETFGQKVKVFDNTGKLLRTMGGQGHEQGQFYYAKGLNVDQQGNVYVADSNNYRIQVFTPDGKFKSMLQGSLERDAKDGYVIPRGIAFDKNGYLWTANMLAGGISVTDQSGKRLALFNNAEPDGEDTLQMPTSVFIDENNRLYVTELGKNRVLVYQIK